MRRLREVESQTPSYGVTWSKTLNLSEHQFLICEMGVRMHPLHGAFVKNTSRGQPAPGRVRRTHRAHSGAGREDLAREQHTGRAGLHGAHPGWALSPAPAGGIAQRWPSSSCLHPDWLPAQPVPCGEEASLSDPGDRGTRMGCRREGGPELAGQDERAERGRVASKCVGHRKGCFIAGVRLSAWRPWGPHFQKPRPVSSQHKPQDPCGPVPLQQLPQRQGMGAYRSLSSLPCPG